MKTNQAIATGFTLIEMMIVVAIIGILSAIAIPQYQDYTARARVTEAVSGLAAARTQIEQFYQDNRTYVGWRQTNNPAAGRLAALKKSGTSFFDFTVSAEAADSYTIQAVGIGSMEGLTYTVNQNNVRTTTVAGLAAAAGWTASANCWRTNKTGC